MKWQNVPVINSIKFKNATLHKYTIISDNKKYRFEPNGVCLIPADAAEVIYNQHKHRGIYPLFDGQDEKAADREAKMLYMTQGLDVFIENWKRAIEEREAAGRKYDREPMELTALKKERADLAEYLNVVAPVQEAPSYMATLEKRRGRKEELNEATAG